MNSNQVFIFGHHKVVVDQCYTWIGYSGRTRWEQVGFDWFVFGNLKNKIKKKQILEKTLLQYKVLRYRVNTRS